MTGKSWCLVSSNSREENAKREKRYSCLHTESNCEPLEVLLAMSHYGVRYLLPKCPLGNLQLLCASIKGPFCLWKPSKWTNEILYGILSSCKPSDLSQEAPKAEHLERAVHTGKYRSKYLNFDKVLSVMLCRNSKSKNESFCIFNDV